MTQKGIVDQGKRGKLTLVDRLEKGNFREMAADIELIEKDWIPQHVSFILRFALTKQGIDHVSAKLGPMKIRLVIENEHEVPVAAHNDGFPNFATQSFSVQRIRRQPPDLFAQVVA